MRRKPKYLDRERRAERAMREYWDNAQWSPTQRKDFLWSIREEVKRIVWANVISQRYPTRQPLMKTLD